MADDVHAGVRPARAGGRAAREPSVELIQREDDEDEEARQAPPPPPPEPAQAPPRAPDPVVDYIQIDDVDDRLGQEEEELRAAIRMAGAARRGEERIQRRVAGIVRGMAGRHDVIELIDDDDDAIMDAEVQHLHRVVRARDGVAGEREGAVQRLGHRPDELRWRLHDVAPAALGLPAPAPLRPRIDELVRLAQREARAMGGVSREMIKMGAALRKEDERNNPSPVRYTRECPICATENPAQRAVYTRCGHIICFPCAVDIAKNFDTADKCPTCRSMSSFVRIFEDEQ